MELTGKQKAQLLISLLEENSAQVLSKLDPTVSKEFSSFIEEAPELSNKELSEFLQLAINDIEQTHQDKEFNMDDFDHIEDVEGSSDFDDLETEEHELQEDPYPKNYKHPEEIAKTLEEQPIQLIAFFMSKLDVNLKSLITEHLSESTLENVALKTVEKMPVSDRIFNQMFENIVLLPEKENANEEEVEENINEHESSDPNSDTLEEVSDSDLDTFEETNTESDDDLDDLDF